MDIPPAEDAAWRQMVWSSLTWWERLEAERAGHATGNDPDQAASIEGRWRAAVGDKADGILERRLSWAGISLSEMRVSLARTNLSPQAPLPRWALFLHEVTQDFARSSQAPLAPDGPPFAPIFCCLARAAWGIAQPAWSRLSSSLALAPELPDGAISQIAVQLSRWGAPGLFPAFKTAREAAPELAFEELMQAWQKGGLTRRWMEMPALARGLANMSLQTGEQLAELAGHLLDDLHDLGSLGGQGGLGGAVVELRPGLSDRHRGGRQVAAVRFASGLTLFYKPKPLDRERHFGEIVNGLASAGADPDCLPPIPQILTRPDYGWMREVEPCPALSRADAAMAFQRAGGLLAIAHACRLGDLIMDNIIASPHGPVPIDLEAAAQPLCVPAGAEGLSRDLLREKLPAQQEFHLAETGLLPRLSPGGDGLLHDISGLGGAAFVSASRDLDWESPNTREMEPVRRTPAIAPAGNRFPSPDGSYWAPSAFLESIAAGFNSLYGPLMSMAAELAPGLVDLRGRFLFRATQIYGEILTRMRDPANLRCGALHSIEPELLLRPFLRRSTGDARPPAADFLDHERQALVSWDIPWFEVTSEGEHEYFLMTPAEIAAWQARHLSDHDRRRQVALMRRTLALGDHFKGRRHPRSVDVDPGQLFDEARRLADLVSLGGEPDPSLVNNSSPLDEPSPSSLPSLYSGSTGRSLLFAALYHLTKDPKDASLASLYAEPLRIWLEQEPSPASSSAIRGLANGLASCLFQAAAIARLVGDQALECSVRRWLAEEVDSLVGPSPDGHLDLVAGDAGALMALCSLSEAGFIEAHQAISPIVSLRDRILSVAVPHPQMGLLWPDPSQDLAYLGCAHGAAGILAALSRAQRHLGASHNSMEQLRVGWERLLTLLAQPGPLPIAFHGAKPVMSPMASWCHGRPGIALAMIQMMRWGDFEPDPSQRDSLSTAAALILEQGPHPLDHLCCGNAGRLELFLSGADLGDRWHMMRNSFFQSHLKPMVSRREAPGLYRTGIASGDPFMLYNGFFQGLPGIGYQLLRAAAPHSLPPILDWVLPS
jgi:type 2 lantibiotic biosynthesis protein LanM